MSKQESYRRYILQKFVQEDDPHVGASTYAKKKGNHDKDHNFNRQVRLLYLQWARAYDKGLAYLDKTEEMTLGEVKQLEVIMTLQQAREN